MEYNGWTTEKLLAFSNEIGTLYDIGIIKSPIHLSDGSEKQLIIIFKENQITKEDWIFGTWRSHFQWLLSGRDLKELKKQIIDGYSMHIFGNKFFTSAIVGGILPIALGVAWGLKKNNSTDKVYCFVGCMASTGGLFSECVRYAQGFDLPIKFIIENNGLSVNALTFDTWGRKDTNKVIEYTYNRVRPHAGSKSYKMF